MRYLFILFFISSGYNIIAQAAQTAHPQAQLLNPALIKTRLPATEARKQASLWETELQKDSSGKTAWLNTYLWNERDSVVATEEKQNRLNLLMETAGQYIPDQSEYFLMQFLHTGRTDSVALRKAFEMASDKETIYPYRIQYAIRSNQRDQLRNDCMAFDKLQPMPYHLFQYHYNVLISAQKNAVVYARGLNDLVPMSVLQNAYGIRTDITLKYFKEGQFLAENDYLCLTLGKGVISQHPNCSYTGLLVKNTIADAFAELKSNFEMNLDLKYLTSGNIDSFYKESKSASLQKNYLPSLLLMLRYYEKIRDPKQYRIKKIIANIKKYAVFEKNEIAMFPEAIKKITE